MEEVGVPHVADTAMLQFALVNLRADKVQQLAHTSTNRERVEGVVLLAGVGAEVFEHLHIGANYRGRKGKKQNICLLHSSKLEFATLRDKCHRAGLDCAVDVELARQLDTSRTQHQYIVVLAVGVLVQLVRPDNEVGKARFVLVDAARHLHSTFPMGYYYIFYHFYKSLNFSTIIPIYFYFRYNVYIKRYN